MQVLDGIKIIDLTWHIAGPYCTRLLADYGANVVKIEPPWGDPARNEGPFFRNEVDPEKSLLFLHLNTNKRGITLNLKTRAGKRIFRELVRDADILVENFTHGVMSRLGFDYKKLQKINPGLVMTSISNFGQTGPYRHYRASELVLNGMGTAMKSCGLTDREPIKLGGNVVQYQGGAVAAVATMTALFGRETGGEGQHVDVSIMETQLSSPDRRGPCLVGHQYTGEIQKRRGPGGTVAGCPEGIYPCKDGYFDVIGGVMWWPRIFKMFGSPQSLSDPMYGTQEWQIDPDRHADILGFMYPWAAERTKDQIFEAAMAARQPCAPLNMMKDLAGNPHLKAREFFVKAEHPIVGEASYTGAVLRSAEMPYALRRVAPLLGQHNSEILGGLGYSSGRISKLKEAGVI